VGISKLAEYGCFIEILSLTYHPLRASGAASSQEAAVSGGFCERGTPGFPSPIDPEAFVMMPISGQGVLTECAASKLSAGRETIGVALGKA
jgi:hypothetical protein